MASARKLVLLTAALALASASAAAQGPAKQTLDRAAKVREASAKGAVEVPKPRSGAGGAAGQAQQPAAAGTGAAGRRPAASAGERRDPFVMPVKPVDPSAIPPVLPPGKRGLVIGQTDLRGVARTPNGMIAVVTLPNGRTFFLRENDQVFNGRVLRVTEDSVVFEENVVDPLGRMMKREVSKKLPAEQ